jgi:hypothetical protein
MPHSPNTTLPLFQWPAAGKAELPTCLIVTQWRIRDKPSCQLSASTRIQQNTYFRNPRIRIGSSLFRVGDSQPDGDVGLAFIA